MYSDFLELVDHNRPTWVQLVDYQQGDVRRCTVLDLALMSISAAVIWRLEAHRQKQEG